MNILLIIILILLLIGGLPVHSYSANWGIWPSSTLGIVLIILLILMAMGRI